MGQMSSGGEECGVMRLDIYISNHCENCQEALRLADLARNMQDAEVRVINLDTTTERVPARIIATPMYLLDDRIVSLGNPTPDDLLRLLVQMRQERHSVSG